MLYLSGCAGLDLSSMETAVPLKPKKVDVAFYTANSFPLDTVGDTEVYHPNNPSYQTDNLSAGASMINGLKINIGLSPKCELMARYYQNSWSGGFLGEDITWKSRGCRLGVKYLLQQKGNQYLSLAPSVNIVSAEEEVWTGDWNHNGNEYYYDYHVFHWFSQYDAYGFELQLLYSIVLNKHVTFTTIGKTSINYYTEDYRTDLGGKCDITHRGLRANMIISGKHWFWVPELGMEYVPVPHGKNTWLPAISMGLGLHL
jgi:hypothetical protein